MVKISAWLLTLLSQSLLSATAWTTTTTTATTMLTPPNYCYYDYAVPRATTQNDLRPKITGGTPRPFFTVASKTRRLPTELFAKQEKTRRWGFGKKRRTELKKTATVAVSSSSKSAAANAGGNGGFHWTAVKVVQALVVFVLSGIAEIGGGWLVWNAVRENKPWWWAFLGSLVLVLYGFIPTFQPTDSFGRIYAVYGGFFIAMSYVWGWIFDGLKPDMGDIVGGSLALLAVLVILFWPRQQ